MICILGNGHYLLGGRAIKLGGGRARFLGVHLGGVQALAHITVWAGATMFWAVILGGTNILGPSVFNIIPVLPLSQYS